MFCSRSTKYKGVTTSTRVLTRCTRELMCVPRSMYHAGIYVVDSSQYGLVIVRRSAAVLVEISCGLPGYIRIYR